MTAPAFGLTALQSDALTEIANIGSGHAATVLSQLTGHRIMIDVPTLAVAPFDQVTNRFPNDGDALVVLETRMMGDLTGETFFIMSDVAARAVADLMLGREVGAGRGLHELEQSSLIEAGNIIASSFLNALARCVGRLLLPSVPTLRIWPRPGLDPMAVIETVLDMVLFVETQFYVEPEHQAALSHLGDSLRGAFLFAPHPAALEEIFGLIPA